MIKRKPTQTSEVSETIKEVITTNEIPNTETSETEAKPKPARRRTTKVVQPIVEEANDVVEENQPVVENTDSEAISQSDILEEAAAIAKKIKSKKAKEKAKAKAKEKQKKKAKEKEKLRAKKAKEKKKKKEKIKKAKQKAKEKKKSKSKKKKKK
jgi:hypothetical protein